MTRPEAISVVKLRRKHARFAGVFRNLLTFVDESASKTGKKLHNLRRPCLPAIIGFRYRTSMKTSDTGDRDLYGGLIRLHVLHHAAEEPIFGLGMSEELARHGYKLSPGTLYPLLHGLERRGYLRSRQIRNGKSSRRVYTATRAGRKALAAARNRVRELFGELMKGDQ
jgi:PadR family transcriptional regulator, regulatory protein PadR